MVITLIGSRGVGKTTVGAQLAARLGWNFVDADPEIERRAGKSIAQIFADDGEPHFRQLESALLSELLAQDRLVISPGGGAILSPDNRRGMQAGGPVVWLQARVETMVRRMMEDAATGARRPSLTGGDPLAEVAAILAQRQPLYEQTATLAVPTDNHTPAEIVDDIVRQLPAPLTGGAP